MIHWDNFGFDAPTGYIQQNVIHNYTDGKLGTETGKTGNEGSLGLVSSLDNPGICNIEIADSILDLTQNPPSKSELMFTIQGGDYSWSEAEKIILNGHMYDFPKPEPSVPSIEQIELINSLKPYSAILNIDPAHLITGDQYNRVLFE